MCNHLFVLVQKMIISHLTVPTGHGAQVVVCHVFLCVVRIVAPQLSCVTRFRCRKSCCTPQDCPTALLGSLHYLHRSKYSSVRSVFQWRGTVFLAIRTLAYYFNHLYLLHRQWQRSNHCVYLAIESYKRCTQPLLQVIRTCVNLVTTYNRHNNCQIKGSHWVL